MKTFLICMLALFSVGVMQAGEPFKGTLTYNVSGPDARELKTLSLLGDGKLARLDVLMTDKAISVIRNPDTKMMTMLLPERKMAMNVAETSAMNGAGIAGDETGEPTRTVSKETVVILGHDTHLETLVFPSGNKVEAWLAEDMGSFSIPPAFAGSMKTWANSKFVPLRVVKWENGAETVRLEASVATNDTPDASLFVVPADYKSMTMPGR